MKDSTMLRYSLATSVLVIALLTLQPTPSFALSIQDLQVVKISPADGSAVVKTSENGLRLIRVGSSLDQNNRVVEIADGRIVIQSKTPKGLETIIIRIEDGRQKIERIGKIGDLRPPPLAVQE